MIRTVSTIASHRREGQLVILESTIYHGATEEIVLPVLESFRLTRAARRFQFGILSRFLTGARGPDNVSFVPSDVSKVVAAADRLRGNSLAPFTPLFSTTVPLCSLALAEMTKRLENIYRCVDMALVNELKELRMQMKIDLFEVIDAAEIKPFGARHFIGTGSWWRLLPSILSTFYVRPGGLTFTRGLFELAGQVHFAK